jgi:hypothetical protein
LVQIAFLVPLRLPTIFPGSIIYTTLSATQFSFD